jgi:hypothetical protein
MPNFGHSKVLIKTELLLAQKDQFVPFNIFRKFSFDFPSREGWSTGCVDLVAPDQIIFFTDGSLCRSRAGDGVFSDTLNFRESYVLGRERIDEYKI